MIPKAMQPLDRVLECFEHALAQAPADYAELVWIERRQRRAGRQRLDAEARRYPTVHERCVLVRVIEAGRCGHFRTDSLDLHEIDDGIRQALAQARVALPSPRETAGEDEATATATTSSPSPSQDALFDSRLARLKSAEGLERASDLEGRDTAVDFVWSEGRVVVADSTGRRRRTRVTCARLRAESGSGPGAGVARAAGRTLEDLDGVGIVELSRRRVVAGEEAQEPAAGAPVVLAPAAAAALVAELSARLWRRRHGVGAGEPPYPELPDLDPSLEIYDDGSDAAGLPFPFDLRGRGKGLVLLLAGGKTPGEPVDPVRSALGAGGDEDFPCNLFLAAGAASEEELLAAAEGGVWIGSLDGVECRGERPVARAWARQRRRIAGGRPAAVLADRPWEEDLASALGAAVLVARRRLRQAAGDGVFGGCTAPALAYRLGPL